MSSETTTALPAGAMARETHEGGGGEPAPPVGRQGASAGRRPGGRRVMVGALVGVLGLGGAGYWWAQRGFESTDDAQIDAEVVPLPARIGGVVTKVLVVDNQHVREGEVLAELDAEPLRARLAQAEAALSVAEANARGAEAEARVAERNALGGKAVAQASLRGASVGASASGEQIAEAAAQVESAEASRRQAATELGRAESLFGSGAVSKAALDQARTTADMTAAGLDLAKARLAALRASAAQAQTRVQEASARLDQTSDTDAPIELARARAASARAQVGTAKAARDLAALDLSYATVVAPRAGVVSKKSVGVGQMVAPGQALGMLVPDQRVWVTGNFKETQLAHVRVGQPATFTVDAYGGRELRGEVESLSGATGARFALLPPDNATGNFTKVVQRVPVRVRVIDPPAGLDLRPGMSVELSIDARH